jgi:hypothetical protein
MARDSSDFGGTLHGAISRVADSGTEQMAAGIEQASSQVNSVAAVSEEMSTTSSEIAQLGFAKVLVNHEIRNIRDKGVMAHLIKGPYIMFFQPMMEEPGWRKHL